MAQVLRPDNIGDLSRTSGTLLTLAAGSYVTVGGQQYINSTALTVNTALTGAGGLDTGAVAANSTYYVYGVASAGSLTLVASLSATTVVGFTGKKMLGAFTTDALAAIDYIFSTAQNPGEPLKDVPGTETKLGSVIFPDREYQNLVINGNFDYWQRNLTFTINNTVVYTADRFAVTAGAAATLTVTRETTELPSKAQSLFKSTQCLKVTNLATTDGSLPAATLYSIRHSLEGVDYATLHGGTHFTISFWIRSSVVGNYCLAIRSASGGSQRAFPTTFTINLANTWERKNIIVPVDTTDTGWAFSDGVGLQFEIVLAAGPSQSSGMLGNVWQTNSGVNFSGSGQVNFVNAANQTLYLSQVMVVKGSVPSTTALTFNRAGRTIQEEFAMCQRYFEKSVSATVNIIPSTPTTSVGTRSLGILGGIANANTLGSVTYVVPKRNNANTIVVWAPTTGTNGSIRHNGADLAVTTASSGDNGFHIINNSGGAVSAATIASLYHFYVDCEI